MSKSDTNARLKRIRYVEKFRPVKEQTSYSMQDVVFNYIANEFPTPVTMLEMFHRAKLDGYEFTKIAFKFHLYSLQRKGKLKKIRTYRGVYWLADKKYLNR